MGALNSNTNGNPFRSKYALFGSGFCFPKDGLLQLWQKSSDTEIIDGIGKDNRPTQRGRALIFNGTDNWIDIGGRVQGGNPIRYENTLISTNLAGYQGILNCGAYGDTSKGLLVRIKPDGALLIEVCDGASKVSITTPVMIHKDVIHKFIFDWSGISGDNAVITVDDTTVTRAISIDWIGDSHLDMQIGSKFTGHFDIFNGRILSYSYTINNQPKVTNNLEQNTILSDRILYTDTTGIQHTFLGDKTDCFKNDDRVKPFDADINTIGYGIKNSLPDVLIPLDKTTLQPVIACDTVRVGSAKNNPKFVGDAFIFNGTDNKVPGFTGDTITDYSSESGITPVIVDDYLFANSGGWIKWVKTSNGKFIVFIGEGTNRRIYDVNNNTSYDILGVVNSANWVKTEGYSYNEKYGFSTPNIPASQLHPTQDVLGNILTNSHVKDGINGSGLYKEPINPLMVANDCNNAFFTPIDANGLVTAKELTIQQEADLNGACGRIFRNVIDRDKNVSKGIVYSTPQSITKQHDINKCYAKTNPSIIQLMEDGEYLIEDEQNLIE